MTLLYLGSLPIVVALIMCALERILKDYLGG